MQQLFHFFNYWRRIKPFTGTLDGKGHSITNFSIDKPSDSSVGMFASLSGEIKI